MKPKCPKCWGNNTEKRGENFVCPECQVKFDTKGAILGHASLDNRSPNGHSSRSEFGDKRGNQDESSE